MSWSPIVAPFTISANTTSSIKKDTTGADLIVVALARGTGGSTPTMLDDQNGNANTYIPLTESATFDSFCELYYCHLPLYVGPNHFWGCSAIAPAMGVWVFSGSKATAFTSVPENGNGITSPGGTSNQTGSVSPIASGDLVLSACSNYIDTGSRAIDSSFGGLSQVPFVPGVAFPLAIAHKIVTGAENPTWSWSGSQPSNTKIASFEVAGGAVVARANRLALMGVA